MRWAYSRKRGSIKARKEYFPTGNLRIDRLPNRYSFVRNSTEKKGKKLLMNCGTIYLIVALLAENSHPRADTHCVSQSSRPGCVFLPLFFSFFFFAVKVIHVIALFCIEATMTSPFYREYRKVRVDPRKCRAGNRYGTLETMPLKAFTKLMRTHTHARTPIHTYRHRYTHTHTHNSHKCHLPFSLAQSG